MTLDYVGGTNTITSVLKWEREAEENVRAMYYENSARYC